MTTPLYMAPMQGLTDFVFRQQWQKHFSGIDKFFTPFIFFDKQNSLANKHKREVVPHNNCVENTVPQILTNNAEEFLSLCHMLEQWGYGEVNLNMGCPFPMVVNKNCGAGILPLPELLKTMLNSIHGKTNLKISVKLRLGLKTNDEIGSIIPLLNDFPFSEVIIHPRNAKQMYSGTIDLDQYAWCLSHIKHPTVYNGDITTGIEFNSIMEAFPETSAIMIGRGIVMNPFLAEEIKQNTRNIDMERFRLFHDSLLEHYSSYLEGGDKQIIMKMQEKWEYFTNLFPDDYQTIKKIKKATSMQKYMEAYNVL